MQAIKIDVNKPGIVLPSKAIIEISDQPPAPASAQYIEEREESIASLPNNTRAAPPRALERKPVQKVPENVRRQVNVAPKPRMAANTVTSSEYGNIYRKC